MKYIIYISLTIFFIASSCKHEPNVSPIKICFSSQVQPILIANCGECHSEGDFSINTYEHLMNSNLIKPGKPYKSALYNAITQQMKIAPNYMPPSKYARLSTEQTNIIFQWILQGAENTNCDTLSCDTNNVTYNTKIAPIINNNCIGCHSGSSASGGIQLNTYLDVKTLIANGKIKTSVINRSSNPMPPSQSINACSINQLNNWITNGSPE